MGVVTPENVRELASHPEGTRTVQRALDEASSDDARRELALQFKGHVWSTVMCPYANYALQKCVATLRPVDVQFIIDELSQGSNVLELARHKFGCRLLQRLFEHCRADQVHHLGGILLTEGIQLCRHNYGNSIAVLNLAFEVCDVEQRLILGRVICETRGLLVKLAQKRHGHKVARSALEAIPTESTELEKA